MFNVFCSKFSGTNNYICGDFNINLLNYDVHDDTKIFVDNVFANGLMPLINRPTRVTSESKTIIDNIFTSNLSDQTRGGIIIADFSDHQPVFQICAAHKHKTVNSKVIYKRNTCEANLENLKSALLEVDWSPVLRYDDVNVAYETFMTLLTYVYNRTCPIRTVNVTSKIKPGNPWMTNSLINACKKRNHLHKTFLRLRTTSAKQRYKNYRNKLTAILRTTRKQYYSSKLEEYKGNMKSTWSFLKGILGRGKTKSTPCDKFVKDGEHIGR